MAATTAWKTSRATFHRQAAETATVAMMDTAIISHRAAPAASVEAAGTTMTTTTIGTQTTPGVLPPAEQQQAMPPVAEPSVPADTAMTETTIPTTPTHLLAARRRSVASPAFKIRWRGSASAESLEPSSATGRRTDRALLRAAAAPSDPVALGRASAAVVGTLRTTRAVGLAVDLTTRGRPSASGHKPHKQPSLQAQSKLSARARSQVRGVARKADALRLPHSALAALMPY